MTNGGGGASWFAPDDAGLHDFLRVYDEHYDALMAATTRVAEAHATFAAILRAMPPAERERQNRESRERLRRAAAGAWQPYESELRTQGTAYARLGIGFADWYDLVGAFKRDMVPLLIAAYGATPERLGAALQSMMRFVDRSMMTIGAAYLDAEEELVTEQRKLAERNEERYRMLFDNGPVAIWVYDLETLRFLEVNRAACEQYGYSETEFLAMTIEDLRHPDDIARLRAENERRKSLRSATNLGEWRHRRKDGSSIDVELRLENFIYLGRRAHLIVAADVTERRRAAQALVESEERYRSLVAATSAVVWTTDGDGRFAAPQLSWQAYTGQSWEEHGGLGWLHAVHADDRARVAAAWAGARASLTLFFAEGRLWHAPSAAFRYFEARAVPLLHADGTAREWIGTVSDVDDKEKAEQPGRFFTLSLDFLCIAGLDGYFKRLNPTFGVLGYTEAELLATPFLDFVHEDDRAATIAEVEKLARGEPTVQFENRYRCKDGSYRTLNWKSAADPSGLIYAAARDITEPKRIEAERVALNRRLTEQNEELTRASRAKSDFLAMMSHELRTPLNSIIGFSEVLIDGKFGALTEKQSRYLQNVLQSGRHLLGLINDLLDLSKIEAGRLEVVRQACSPRLLVAEAVATLQPLAEARNVELAVDAGASLPAISADAARVKQVLYNLISNAIKFTPAAGRVSISCTVRESGGAVRIVVRDTGTGISDADRARLFTPFTQLANAKDRGGTGLGLALTKQLVEIMGGDIGVDSELGAGSSFFVDLPLHGAPAPAERPPAVAPSTTPLALVVDDDAAARELLVLALQGAGYRVIVATSGDEALALARRQRPAVITLDVFLPTIDGWDVLRLLKNDPATADVPVVMVTISSDRAKAFSLGALEHLTKPVGRDALLAALARRNFTTKVKTSPVNVLAIDDDPKQLELFVATLQPHGFHVRTETTGKAGIAAAMNEPVDLVLLDLVMPDISGIEVVTALRANQRTRALPILLVTAHELGVAERARLNGDVEAILSKATMRMADLLSEIDRVLRSDG